MKKGIISFYLLLIVCVATILFIGRSRNRSSNLASDRSRQSMADIHNTDAKNSQRLEEIKKEIEANPKDTLKMREYANMLGGVHRDEEAAKVFENILLIGPKRIDVMLVLTYIYYNLGHIQKAEEYTNRVLTINKDNPEANFNIAIIELRKGNKDKAKQILNSVIKRFPGNRVAEYAKATVQKL